MIGKWINGEDRRYPQCTVYWQSNSSVTLSVNFTINSLTVTYNGDLTLRLPD